MIPARARQKIAIPKRFRIVSAVIVGEIYGITIPKTPTANAIAWSTRMMSDFVSVT